MSNEEILNVMQSTIESYVDLEGLEITPRLSCRKT